MRLLRQQTGVSLNTHDKCRCGFYFPKGEKKIH